MKDISFKVDHFTFGFRSVGVLIQNGQLLLQREKGGNEYALPGGTVKLGESTGEALLREWKEETGTDIVIQRLLWTEETFWEYHGQHQHGIAFYYLIDLCGQTVMTRTQKDNSNIVFEWKPLEELQNIILYPAFAKTELFALHEHPRHFISRE